MSFISPALLWALPLAAVPVILHLLFRWRRRPVVFSDTFLLSEIVARVMPRRRLEEWLLTLVRAALVALLVAAFARPVLHWGLGRPASEKDALDVVVLLDESYSMGLSEAGLTRFQRAQRLASEVLSSLRPQDRASVVAFSDRIESTTGELQSGAAKLAAWVERAAPTAHGTDYRLAFESAYSILSPSTASRKAIVLLSDGARSAFRDWPGRALDTLPFYDPKVRIAAVDWADRPWNAALEGADFSRGVLRAHVALWGRPSAASDLSLWQGKRLIETRRLVLKEGPSDIDFAVAPATGIYSGHLALRADALPLDDTLSFAFAVQPRPKVLVLESGSREFAAYSGAYFLKRVFKQADLPFEPAYGDPADLPGARLSGYAAVMLLSPGAVDQAGADRLDRFVRDGGGLWVFPEDDPRSLASLSGLLPARVAGQRGAVQGIQPDAASAWKLDFLWDDFDLGKVAFNRLDVLEPERGAEAWFRASGTPVFVEGQRGYGRVALSAAPLKASWTNLALKPLFAPLLSAGLSNLASAGKDRVRRMLYLEQPFTRSWEPPEAPPAGVTIVAPDGTRAGVPVAAGRLQYALTGTPGLYRVLAYGRPEDDFAVNLDPALREDDVRREDSPPWPRLKEDTFGGEFQRLLFGEEARPYVLLLALLLLLAESWLAQRAAAKSAPPAAPAPAPRREAVAP